MGPVSLLVVAGIPAYNEERTIAKVVVVSLRQVDKVVVCNDGSTDMTGIIASKLGAEVISHDRNLGKGEALRSLFKVARSIGADVLVTLDGDGQHNPFYHTLDVVFSIVKLTSIRHPLMFYGGAGLALVLVGLYFLIRTILLYFSSKALDFLTVTVGFVSFAFVLIGLLTFFTGVILFTITTVIRKVEK